MNSEEKRFTLRCLWCRRYYSILYVAGKETERNARDYLYEVVSHCPCKKLKNLTIK